MAGGESDSTLLLAIYSQTQIKDQECIGFESVLVEWDGGGGAQQKKNNGVNWMEGTQKAVKQIVIFIVCCAFVHVKNNDVVSDSNKLL